MKADINYFNGLNLKKTYTHYINIFVFASVSDYSL